MHPKPADIDPARRTVDPRDGLPPRHTAAPDTGDRPTGSLRRKRCPPRKGTPDTDDTVKTPGAQTSAAHFLQGKALTMNPFRKVLLASALVLGCPSLHAQGGSYDVFLPIAKYISQGDAERLSAWFADNLEVTIQSKSVDSSKSQAKQILRSFFNVNTPQSFDITHTVSRSNVKYALGSLSAGGEVYMVTIFVSSDGETYKIQQLKIDSSQ